MEQRIYNRTSDQLHQTTAAPVTSSYTDNREVDPQYKELFDKYTEKGFEPAEAELASNLELYARTGQKTTYSFDLVEDQWDIIDECEATVEHLRQNWEQHLDDDPEIRDKYDNPAEAAIDQVLSQKQQYQKDNVPVVDGDETESIDWEKPLKDLSDIQEEHR